MHRKLDPARVALAAFGGLALAFTVVWSIQPRLEPDPPVRVRAEPPRKPVVLHASEPEPEPEPGGNEVLAGLAALSRPADDNPRGFSDEVLGRQAGRPADVRGIEQMMAFRALDVRGCLRRDGPKRMIGEERVMLRFTLAAHPDEPGVGHIAEVTAPRDPDDRYIHFLACVMDVTDHERFKVPVGGEVSVTYAVPLIRE